MSCQGYLARLEVELDEWTRRGAAVAGVFPQGLDAVSGFATREEIPFPILADPDRKMTRDYGVYVRFSFDSWNMARPSVFLIDPAGTVRRLWVGSHQLDWPVTADFWEVIDRHDGRAEH